MGLNFLENKCLRISEISVLPSLIAKLLSTVWDEVPCMSKFQPLYYIESFSTLCYEKHGTVESSHYLGDAENDHNKNAHVKNA